MLPRDLQNVSKRGNSLFTGRDYARHNEIRTTQGKAKPPMTDEAQAIESDPIDIHYEKGPTYANIHADGAIVAPNGRGSITVSFYSQRFTIPKLAQLVRGPDDGTGEEKEIDGKSGLFRQVESTVFLDVTGAKSLIEWLQKAIEFTEKHDSSEQQEDEV